ncbi:hypothetical protein PBRA_009179 [Plasmodiophora brassicae]|nr:hypothetical protein PBRA_009179 [Plasmodiophora brassicae]
MTSAAPSQLKAVAATPRTITPGLARREQNRTGRSQDKLRLLGANFVGQTPSPVSSYTAKRRQNLDHFIERAEQNVSGGIDMAQLVLMMEERAEKRQEEREEREEQSRREREEREHIRQQEKDEREERERIRQEEKEEREMRYRQQEDDRRARLEQMQMAIMAKLFGDIAKP